jgi:hypothetical protein
MDYRQEIQRIADRLKTDRGVDPKWRNKITARLEELAAMSHMLTGTRAPTAAQTPNLDQIADGMGGAEIPDALKQYANPNQIQPPQVS